MKRYILVILFLFGCGGGEFTNYYFEKEIEYTAKVGEAIYLAERGLEGGLGKRIGRAVELKYLGAEDDRMKVRYSFYRIYEDSYIPLETEELSFTDNITYRDIEIEVVKFNESQITYIVK